MKSKKCVRAHYRKVRDSLSQARRLQGAKALVSSLKARYEKASLVLSFSSIQSEVDTTLLNQTLIQYGKLVLPTLCDGTVHLYHVGNLDDLIEGKFGILNPDPHKSVALSIDRIDLALVPGLAFDAQGHRIGYGKGYYDQLLKPAPHLSKIGICFKEQLTEILPKDPWDIAVDDILAV